MNCLKGIERNCFACGYNINERYMLFSDNKYWHSKGCFRCSKCGLDLGGERNAWFKSGMYLCRKDYLSLREPSVNWSRYCFGCKGFIRADMYVLKISASLVFHVQCLCCSKCKNSLKTGDRFCLTADNQGILCYSNCAAVQPGSQSSVAAASNGTAAQGNSNGKGGGKRGRQPMIKK